MTTDPNRLLKPEEAAAFLGLQPCTLAAWREDGSMPGLAFFKIGKAVRYRYGDVLAFIETRRATSTLAARQLGEKSTAILSSRTGTEARPHQAKRRRDGAGDQKSLF
ncbi:MAG: helix-turn-helix domain-containing protein [Alphaproteobacteria bacterium]|nr:helix-turn-helix domain-containing protein [Alphaproteobacteria bacterium]